MRRDSLEAIIAEEIEALGEGAFDDAIGKVKGFFGKGKKKKSPEQRADQDGDGTLSDAEADAWNELSADDGDPTVKAGPYGKGKETEEYPPNVVAGKPRKLDLTNPPVLLNPILMYQKYAFVWDYDVPEGKMPKKRKPKASSGSQLFYEQRCRRGLPWYCSDAWYTPKKKAKEILICQSQYIRSSQARKETS